MDKETMEEILIFQKKEITDRQIYLNLARLSKDPENKKILTKIARDEDRHYDFWKTHSQKNVKPDLFKINFYTSLARILGLVFAVKLMEMGEENAQNAYAKFVKKFPHVKELISDENKHQLKTITLIHEQFLKYAGSLVLGLNDALVELTGVLAGLTFALQNAQLIAVAGFITGFAASLSMAASEYLSTKTENINNKNALRASFYTGAIYLIVVLLLISPYLFLSNIYLSLFFTLLIGFAVIVVFCYYVSVARGTSFKKQVLEMSLISFGVALISFTLGLILRSFVKIDV
ncbi:rubrerythrin family protein [Candidatus Gottesmanbacteria bacterium RBG_16_37_8]|uniref:Rubrerythrin family protein n=1 Tax=Candidatus Gottesmanbacteria bacterium RBG_16_37_8 TaxID=1798371 RepID=A0A1F5YTX9_9BACT|nr:MAG: rubrerythrin family protein [Candidatus Gottesmanbacteria bacterium RBG_16_37_8]